MAAAPVAMEIRRLAPRSVRFGFVLASRARSSCVVPMVIQPLSVTKTVALPLASPPCGRVAYRVVLSLHVVEVRLRCGVSLDQAASIVCLEPQHAGRRISAGILAIGKGAGVEPIGVIPLANCHAVVIANRHSAGLARDPTRGVVWSCRGRSWSAGARAGPHRESRARCRPRRS